MPKVKPCKGILKRLKVSANFKIRRNKAGRRHMLSGKRASVRRQMRKREAVVGAQLRNLKRALRLPMAARTPDEAPKAAPPAK
jgi:large subunit ribosomal protein L35